MTTLFPNKKKDKAVNGNGANESDNEPSSETANLFNTLTNGNHQIYQSKG